MYITEEALPLEKWAKLLLLYTSVTTRINRAIEMYRNANKYEVAADYIDHMCDNFYDRLDRILAEYLPGGNSNG